MVPRFRQTRNYERFEWFTRQMGKIVTCTPHVTLSSCLAHTHTDTQYRKHTLRYTEYSYTLEHICNTHTQTHTYSTHSNTQTNHKHSHAWRDLEGKCNELRFSWSIYCKSQQVKSSFLTALICYSFSPLNIFCPSQPLERSLEERVEVDVEKDEVGWWVSQCWGLFHTPAVYNKPLIWCSFGSLQITEKFVIFLLCVMIENPLMILWQPNPCWVIQ